MTALTPDVREFDALVRAAGLIQIEEEAPDRTDVALEALVQVLARIARALQDQRDSLEGILATLERIEESMPAESPRTVDVVRDRRGFISQLKVTPE